MGVRTRSRRWVSWMASLAGLALALPSAAEPAPPSERLPSSHWACRELRELEVAGVLDSLGTLTLPVRRGEVAAALLRSGAAASKDPRVARLRREFALEVRELQPSSDSEFTGPAVRVVDGPGDLRLSPDLAAGESRDPGEAWRSDGVTRMGLKSTFVLRPRLALSLDVVARKYPGSAAYADPLFRGTEITMLAEQAYAQIDFDHGSFTVGRDRSRWGLGQTGSLILGDGAASMTSLEYELSWHGLRFRSLTSLLQPGSGEYLSAHRVEVAASPRLMLAATEAARYHSNQPEWLYLAGVVPYTLVQRMQEADAGHDSASASLRNNLMVAFEAALRPRTGLELGGTLLLDDLGQIETTPQRTRNRVGYQLSGLWTQVGAVRPFTVRAEFTRVDNYVYSVEYGENFIHQGRALGYPSGPDVARAWAQVLVDLDRAWRAGIEFDYTAKGEGRLGEPLDTGPAGASQPPPPELSGVVEKTSTLAASARWLSRDNVQFNGRMGLFHAANAGHVEGAGQSQMIGSFSMEVRW